MTGEPKPSGGCSGESEGTSPGRPNLAVTVQRFAAVSDVTLPRS